MIRSAPSIVTTGAGGRLQRAEVGQEVGLAGGAQLLGALVPADLREDVDGGRHIGSVSCRLSCVPCGGCGTCGSSSTSRTGCTLLRRSGCLRCGSSAICSSAAASTRSSSTATRSCSWPRRDGRVVGRISAHYDDTFNAYHGNRWGMFGFLELEDEPDVLPALLDAAEAWLKARGRDRMVGPMDFTMNDEFGVHDRGLRARADDQAALAPALLRRAAARRPGSRRRSTCYMWELHISDRSKILPVIFKLAEELEPRHGIRLRHMTRRSAAARPGPLRRGLQRGVERELGLRALRRRPTSTSTPPSCSWSSTATGSWSPRRPRARPRRSRSRCRTSTRCSSA